MKILITGGTGKLGRELIKVFPNSIHPTRHEMDITKYEMVSSVISREKPEIIIHAAALTGIRQCEENKELAWNTNVIGTENLVKACKSYVPDCYFVHISTACVFYGDKGDYVETDIPYPKNFYSLTKLLSEFIVVCSGLKKWLIIRTNFVAREKWPYPKAFVDRFGTYLFADEVAQAIKDLIEKNLTGIVHVHGNEKLSMYELAKITTPDVQPMTLNEYSGPPLTIDMSLRSIRIKPYQLRKSL